MRVPHPKLFGGWLMCSIVLHERHVSSWFEWRWCVLLLLDAGAPGGVDGDGLGGVVGGVVVG